MLLLLLQLQLQCRWPGGQLTMHHKMILSDAEVFIYYYLHHHIMIG